MNETLTRGALAIAVLPGVGRRRLREALRGEDWTAIRDAAAFATFVRRLAPSLRMRAPDAATLERAWTEASELASACERRGWDVVASGRPEYPPRLAALSDPPALLFVHGRLTADGPVVAVIGTRNPTTWGEATARRCAAEAAAAGATVVAGLAWGIDTAAHTACVDSGAPTWATLPSGLDIIYPDANRRLAQRIVETGGALVSEYLPGTRPQPSFFVERDRLQAAFADTVIVIETGLTGGTHHTIGFARALGVPLRVAWPGEVDAGSIAEPSGLPEPQQGTWRLLRDGMERIIPEQVGALVASLGRATPRPANAPRQGALW